MVEVKPLPREAIPTHLKTLREFWQSIRSRLDEVRKMDAVALELFLDDYRSVERMLVHLRDERGGDAWTPEYERELESVVQMRDQAHGELREAMKD